MCRMPSATEAAVKAGLSIRKTLCEICPFSGECEYLKQEREIVRACTDSKGAVLFGVHAFLFIPLPGG